MTDFDIVPTDAIEYGHATDAYFDRTEETLEHADVNPEVTAEVTLGQFPSGNYHVFAGIKDVAALFEGLPVDVDALEEGRLFDGGPVVRIKGDYLSFARFETALLGFLSHASGFATRALEARTAAPNSTVMSFGARHVHPSITATVERASMVAGLDGFSHVAAGQVLGREASGTMPHSLIIPFGHGNQEDAWRSFDEAVNESVPRIALCDTFDDETDEVRRAIEELGDDLDGVRLDTTGSRRGDFRHIIKEVRWELNAYDLGDTDIFVSGGIDPEEMRHTRDLVDGFGIGSHITDGDPLDFGLDIVEMDGEPVAKRGKLPDVKEVYRTLDGGHHVQLVDADAPDNSEELLKPTVRDGEVVRDFDIDEAAERLHDDPALDRFADKS